MVGLNDLNVEAKWRFRFLGHGTSVSATPGTLFVDVGNVLEPGVIDTHQSDTPYGSCASTIARNPHLILNHILSPIVDQYIRKGLDGQRRILVEFVTHESPDWDGLCSFYLCKQLVQTGGLPPRAITEAVIHAADIVDQGRAVIGDEVCRPFLLYEMLKDAAYAEHRDWGLCIERGLELLAAVLGRYNDDVPLDALVRPVEFDGSLQTVCEKLRTDVALFKQDLADAEMFEVTLPTKAGTTRREKAFAFKNQPRCSLHKYWVRERTNCEVLLVPYQAPHSDRVDRVVISVNPEGGFNLQRLGFVLEEAEKKERIRLNDSALRRGGQPRWGDRAYCDNDDPWYDGRGHDYTIVDSPRSGTWLSFEKIKDILRSPFYGINLKTKRLRLFFVSGPIPESEFANWVKVNPFEQIPGCLNPIRQVSLKHKVFTTGRCHAQIIVCDVTRQAVLVVDFPEDRLPETLNGWPSFLQRVSEDKEVQAAVSEISRLGAAADMSVAQCYMLSGVDPCLQMHSPKNVSAILAEMAGVNTSGAILQEFGNLDRPFALVGRHASTYFITDSKDSGAYGSIVLYALFMKTGFNSFSQRLGQSLPRQEFRNPEVLWDILRLQRDFSRFLAEYCFSEISSVGSVQELYSRLAEAMHLVEIRQETQEEMERLAELALVLEEQNKVRREKALNNILLVLAFVTSWNFISQEVSAGRRFFEQDIWWIGGLGVMGFMVVVWLNRRKRL